MLSLIRKHKQSLKNDCTGRFLDCIVGINNTFLRDRLSHSKLFRVRGKNVERKTGVYLLCGGIALLALVFIAGAVAASSAAALLNKTGAVSGVVTLGDGRLNDRALLDDVIRRGITVFEYIGSGA